MKSEDFLKEVNGQLFHFFESNSFVLTQIKEWDERGKIELTWKNPAYFLRIYSDPQGGEVNCQLAKIFEGESEDIEWHYLYALFPLSSEELKIFNVGRFVPLDEQLRLITRKLISNTPLIW